MSHGFPTDEIGGSESGKPVLSAPLQCAIYYGALLCDAYTSARRRMSHPFTPDGLVEGSGLERLVSVLDRCRHVLEPIGSYMDRLRGLPPPSQDSVSPPTYKSCRWGKRPDKPS